MASIKKTGENTYQITVSCGYDSAGKKIRRKTTYKPELLTKKGNPKNDKTIEKEVEAYAADFERKVLTGQYTEGYNLTFEKYALKYLSECAEESQAPRTLQSTRAAVKEFVSFFGYLELERLTPMYLQEYFNKMAKRPKANGAPLSHGTVKRKAATLSAMLSQAVRWNLLTSNPMARVQLKAPSVPAAVSSGAPGQNAKCFTRQQAGIFLDALDQPAYYTASGMQRRELRTTAERLEDYRANRRNILQYKFFFYLAIFTGCRRGELMALTWDDLDFEHGAVSITKSVCRVDGQIIIKATKTQGSVRAISLPPVVLTLGKEWKTEQAYYRLSIGSQWKGDGHIFTGWNGELMGLETPYQIFRRIIRNYNACQEDEALRLPVITLHGLRHTAATLLIVSGIDIRTVSGRLGHSCASTTLNIYSHALEEMDRKASDALEEALIRKA